MGGDGGEEREGGRGEWEAREGWWEAREGGRGGIEGGREGRDVIDVNHPAIVREIPHFDVFPAFPHFSENVQHFWLYFEKRIFLQIVIFLAPERHFVRNGSFTVKDFRLYDETSSSKGRSPAAHIAQTSQLPCVTR